MSQRPTLLLCCGLLCDARVWAPQKAAFETDFDIVIVDFIGLDSFDDMADKALTAASGRFALAGHSMGGRVAFEIFRRAPERIERLALLDTGAIPGDAAEIEGRMKLVRLGYEKGMRAVADVWLPPMVRAEHHANRSLMNDIVDMICNSTPEIFERQQRALINRRDFVPLLPKMTCPALVATGRYDAWSPVSAHEEMAARMPNAKLVVFEEAGHMSTLETPDDVNRAFANWLA